MKEQFLMGNQAIALGAIRAGVNLVSGYPGTPSSEILETVAKHNPGDVYVEWSVNEKSAMEVAAGAAYAGARAMVTMKQVGLNVASDPLMSLSYIGIKGGMVIVAADDPGPISSQTEQDTRHFAQFAKLPVFDPSSPEEAYEMIGEAFAYSEKYGRPVLFRPTTRVCHACATIAVDDTRKNHTADGFVKDSRWVIFPRLTYQNHLTLEKQLAEMGRNLSSYDKNALSGTGKKGIACGGVSVSYVREALGERADEVKVLKIATPNPFPEDLALRFLDGLDEVLVVEELDPVIEKELLFLCGKHGVRASVHGKLDGSMPNAGEYSVDIVKVTMADFLGWPVETLAEPELPPLPVRPPVLCAGCPHRASFYAVKQAMKGKKAVFSGDIGCYTLGNAAPLDMVDTCLCMGAGITVAQGLQRIEPDAVHFAFIGDSTFFHTGIPGVINAAYNGTKIVLIVLDNATTAMTGHQPHPGTGRTMMGDISAAISIPDVLHACGVEQVETVNPLDLEAAKAAVARAVQAERIAAVIFKSPCIAVTRPAQAYAVDAARCTGCMRCIRELGCPAIVLDGGKARIDAGLCYGCTVCAQVCPFGAIGKEEGVQ